MQLTHKNNSKNKIDWTKMPNNQIKKLQKIN